MEPVMWRLLLGAVAVARPRRPWFGRRRAAPERPAPAPSPPPTPRYEALPEMARLYERALDKQLEIMGLAEARTDRAVALGVATLGGGLGLVTLIGGGTLDSFDWPLFGLLSLGALVNLVALALLVRGGLADSTALVAGPDAAWLTRHAEDPGWRLLDHRASLLAAAQRDVEANRATLQRAQRRRRTGLHVLAGAVVAYVAAFLYMGFLAIGA